MKIYATLLPLKVEATKENIIGAVFRWLGESPSFKLADKLAAVDSGTDFEITHEKTRLVCLNLTKDNEKITAFCIEYHDATYWNTHISFIDNGTDKSIRIEVERFVREYETKYPGCLSDAVRCISAANLLVKQNGFHVTDKPIYTNNENIDIIADAINGKHDTALPILYISKPLGRFGHEVDPDKLSRELCGVAYVIAEQDIDFAFKLKDRTGEKNPHNGYIGLYYPKITFQRKFGIKEGSSQSNFEEHILTQTRRVAWAKVSNAWSWSNVEIEHRKNREVDEFAGNFDAENNALRQELARTKEKLEEAEQERYDYKLQCDNLREALSQGRINDGLILPAEIKEFFNGEQYDLIVGILEAAILSMNAEHRDHELLSGILQRNKIKGEGLPILDAIEQALKDGGDRMGPREFAQLERYGFKIVSDNKHYKLIYKDNPKYQFTIDKTASDHRTTLNIISDITKKISVYKKR